MKRRLIGVLLTFVMILTLLPGIIGAAEAEAKTPTITLESTESGRLKGSKVQIDVTISNNPGFVSATIPVKWDSSVLKLTEVKNTEKTIPGWFGDPDLTRLPDTYYLAWNNDTYEVGDYKGDGVLCTMVFEVLKDVEAGVESTISVIEDNIMLCIMNWDMYDYISGEVEGVEFAFADGVVTFVDKVIIPGDVNDDGEVTEDDAIYLLFHIMFIDDGLYPIDPSVDLDYNDDGSITEDDAIYLLFHVMFKDDGLYPID